MNAKTDIGNILFLADQLASFRCLARSTISLYATGRGAYLAELEDGSVGLTLRRRDNIILWFAENWPADLEWPSDIPRPKSQSKEPAA